MKAFLIRSRHAEMIELLESEARLLVNKELFRISFFYYVDKMYYFLN